MRFAPLHEDFGVEVQGFDALGPTAPEDIDQLRSALDEHQLLLFRLDERLTYERHIEITSWFGPPSGNYDDDLVLLLKNEDRAGSEKLPFHADFTYTEHPIKVIAAQGVEMPAGGSATAFASGVSSWTRLPQDLQQTVSGLTARHREGHKLSGSHMPVFIADQPVRKLHPRNGRPILYVTEYHAERIDELKPEESQEVLGRLFEVLYDPPHIYTHKWRRNDLLIWDNLSLQHSRPEVAPLEAGTRVLQRVAVNDVSYPELVRRAHEQEAQRNMASA